MCFIVISLNLWIICKAQYNFKHLFAGVVNFFFCDFSALKGLFKLVRLIAARIRHCKI